MPFRRSRRRLVARRPWTIANDAHRPFVVDRYRTMTFQILDDIAGVVVGDTRPDHGSRRIAPLDE